MVHIETAENVTMITIPPQVKVKKFWSSKYFRYWKLSSQVVFGGPLSLERLFIKFKIEWTSSLLLSYASYLWTEVAFQCEVLHVDVREEHFTLKLRFFYRECFTHSDTVLCEGHSDIFLTSEVLKKLVFFQWVERELLMASPYIYMS